MKTKIYMLLLTLAMVMGLTCASFAAPYFKDTQILPVENVKKGMVGVAKTVVQGTKIEEFKVEVLGVMKGEKAGQDLILFRGSGDVIKKTGGIAYGMSGSPVYINGKLVGAVAYAFGEFTDPYVGLINPIKNMLDILKMPDKQDVVTYYPQEPIKISGKDVDKVTVGYVKDAQNKDDSFYAAPVSTPIMVNGLGERAFNRLSSDLSKYNFVPMKTGNLVSTQKVEDPQLVPGAAVGVQLVTGDVDVSAIGTVTYRIGDRILAFGHPFMSKGNVNMLMTTAYVHYVLSSINVPTKLAAPLKPVGVITQDRLAGIGGIIGKYPKMVPFEVTVSDKQLGIKKNYKFQVIQDENMIPELAPSAILQTIDGTIGRIGSGTTRVSLEIDSKDLPQPVKKTNLFFSPEDVAAVSLLDVQEGLGLITQNEFQHIGIDGVKLNIDITDERQTATVEKVNVLQEKVYPGDTIDVEVVIRPYRGEEKSEFFKITLPKDLEPGDVNLTAIGGEGYFADSYEERSDEKDSAKKDKEIKENTQTFDSNGEMQEDFEELINSFVEREQANDVVVEINSGYGEENNANSDGKTNDKSNDKIKDKHTTDYFIIGSKQITLKVLEKGKEDKAVDAEDSTQDNSTNQNQTNTERKGKKI